MAKKSKSTISIVVHDIAENLKEGAGNLKESAGDKVSDIKEVIAEKFSEAKVASGNLLQKAGKKLAGKKAPAKKAPAKKVPAKKTAPKKAAVKQSKKSP